MNQMNQSRNLDLFIAVIEWMEHDPQLCKKTKTKTKTKTTTIRTNNEQIESV